MRFIKIYLIALIVFVAIDAVWLALVAKNFYRSHLGYLMGNEFHFPSAILFYLIFVAGLVYFVILPSSLNKTWSYALLSGAFFGLVCYATYDLTNQATIRGWPPIVTIIDLGWGAFLCGVVSLITFGIIRRW